MKSHDIPAFMGRSAAALAADLEISAQALGKRGKPSKFLDNLNRKANACRADLKFLLEIVPAEWSAAKRRVEVAIATIKNPTEQKITAAAGTTRRGLQNETT